MRIGIFTNTYKPEINGVVRSISTFRDELVRQGHAVYVFAPEAANYEDKDYGVFRYPAIKLPVAVNYPLAIPVSPHIDWVVPRLKLDILHSHHPILVGEEAITFAKQLNLPHVFTHHTQYEEYSHYIPFNQTIVKTLTREVVRAYLARSVTIIAPTESLRAQIVAQYPTVKKRLRVLPSPVDLGRFRPNADRVRAIREKYRLDKKFVFVSVSRLTPEKNVDTLLQAFAQAAKEHPDARLLLVGDGPRKQHLKTLVADLQIASKIIFVGAVGYDDVPHYLAAGDAFAFASTSETQGLVMLEAMAAGLPVVVVNAPGNRDLTVDGVNGFLVENSSAALAAGMRQMLETPGLHETMGKEAHKTAQVYSAVNLTHQLVELYQEAIECYKANPIDYKRFGRESEEQRQFPPQWLVDITGKTEWFDSLTAFWKNLGS